MSLNGALGIASGGLANISLGLSVISQNVANASTPQYAVETATQQSLSAGPQGFGVTSGVVVRASDAGLQNQLAQQVSTDSKNQTETSALSAIQPALGTVGSGNDLGSKLTALQNAFSTLLSDPADQTQQRAVVASADALTSGVRNIAQAYGDVRQSAQNALVSGVAKLQSSLQAVGQLSGQIISLRAQGKSTADLENQRAQAESTISGFVDARFIDQPNGDVMVLTSAGLQLPTTGNTVLQIGGASAGAGASYPGGGLSGIMLGSTDVTSMITGGSIGANLALRDSIIPTYQASLDEFAHTLSTRFSEQGLTLFSDASGTIPTSAGPMLQSGYIGYSNVVQVNPAVDTNPALVRDGTQAIAGSPTGAGAFTPNATGPAGFDTLISRIMFFSLGDQVQPGVPQSPIATTALGTSGTLNASFGTPTRLGDYANAMTAANAQDSNTANRSAAESQAVVTTLQGRMTAETGVSMDAELGQMVVLQNAYGANAKIISTVQAMFNAVLAMVT